MSASPTSSCTTFCPASSRRLAAARTTYACSVPSVSSRAAECIDNPVSDNETPGRAPGVGTTSQFTCAPAPLPYPIGGGLLGALQIGAFAGVHPHFFTLGDELGHLDRHAIRKLGRLGARRLRGTAHDRRCLHDGELYDRRKLDAHGAAVQPLDLYVHLRLQPVGVIAHCFGVERVLLVRRRIHHVHAALIAIQDLELLGLERRLVHKVGGGEASVERVPRDEVSQPQLNEGPQVAWGAARSETGSRRAGPAPRVSPGAGAATGARASPGRPPD